MQINFQVPLSLEQADNACSHILAAQFPQDDLSSAVLYLDQSQHHLNHQPETQTRKLFNNSS